MPYIRGKRVSLEAWQAAQVTRPLYRYHEDGTKRVVNDYEPPTEDVTEQAEQWARQENLRRAGLSVTEGLFGLRAPDVTAADWPGAEDATNEDVRTRKRTGQRAAMALAAIADSMGVPPDDPQLADIDLSGGEAAPLYPGDYAPWLASVPQDELDAIEEPQATTHRADDAQWRAEKGITKPHRPDRPSQQYIGRRKRTIAAYAARHGVTIKQAEQLVTKRGPRAKKVHP